MYMDNPADDDRAKPSLRKIQSAGVQQLPHVVYSFGGYLILLVGVLLSACGSRGNVSLQPQYEASGLLAIYDVSPFLVFESRETAVESQRYIQTQLELLRNRVVLEPILSRSEIAQMPELAGVADRVQYSRDHMRSKMISRETNPILS